MLVDKPGKVFERPGHGLLVWPRRPAHRHRRRLGGPPVADQLAGDFGDVVEPHEDHQGLGVPTLAQSIASTSCPVTKVTAEVCSRCVSGTPV